jgi:cytoskeletal protein CcmA (bactofilin family)
MVRAAFAAGTWYEAGGKVPAELIRELVLGPAEPGSAIRIRGARIDGELSLAYLEARVPILLERCELTDPPVLYWSRLGYLSLQESRMPGIVASDARLDGHLRLTRAVLDGELRLRGATITGGLLLDGALLTNAGEQAVQGERLHVAGDLVATDARVVGEVVLEHAEIEGRLSMDGARLVAPGGQALSATNIRLTGGVFGRRMTVEGEVNLRDSTVGGAVVLSWARLANPTGVALRLSRSVNGGVFLGDVRADGEVRMHGARINHGLSVAGAALRNPGGVALDGDAMRVDGDIEADRLVADGMMRLRGAIAAGTVRLAGSVVGAGGGEGLDATGLQARELDLRFARPPGGQVDLAHAQVGILRDAPESWPARLRLGGLTYQTLLPPDGRLAWLARGVDEYLPQPYEQLAKLYQGYGDDNEARAVRLAQYRRRRDTQPWPGRAWGWLQDVTVGYGYKPGRAVAWLVALLLLGTVFFGVDHPSPVGPGTPPAFNPFLYALDVLLPIVDLGQQSAYAPRGLGAQLVADLLIGSGWVLATTAAAAATRTLRRD